MKSYELTIPIFGHAYVTVEAENEEEAINKALDSVEYGDINTWQAMRKMHDGNVCHYDQPWEVTVDSVNEIE